MTETPERDEYSGVETTGHEWDGIRELDRPLPRWWVYVFYATIIWSVAYWVVMPAWPVFWNGDWFYTQGLLDHSQRENVAEDLADVSEGRAEYREQIAQSSLEEVRNDPALLQIALASGDVTFGENCAPCHGSGAQGFKGFPNLNDDAWIWGGTLEAIAHTIRHGIRWDDDPQTRFNQMPAYLSDGILSAGQVRDVVEYVRRISDQDHDADMASRGAETFEQQCSACHMPDGTGNTDLGAPDLTDAIWLYGGDRQSLLVTVANARNGVMPAWAGRLDETTIKELAVYVHALGGGE